MATATMTSKGQVTVPKAIRDRLKLRAGDRIDFVEEEGRVVLRPRNLRAVDLAGMLGSSPDGRVITIEEMDEDLGRALAEDDERISREWHENRER